MATKVHMEALSPTKEEGQVVRWPTDEGAGFAQGAMIAVVDTEEADEGGAAERAIHIPAGRSDQHHFGVADGALQARAGFELGHGISSAKAKKDTTADRNRAATLRRSNRWRIRAVARHTRRRGSR